MERFALTDAPVKFSVIIPVYRSEDLLETTFNELKAWFDAKGWSYEVILVNDGSPDASWSVIERIAAQNDNVVGVDLLKNVGQHSANFIGLEHMSGELAVTMDDDLQNPPAEIEMLYAKHLEGYDFVAGLFAEKRHSAFRKLGSGFIQWINRRVFPAPEGFRHSNFRLMTREVVQRMLMYRTHYPYTSGLAARMARRPGNAPVEHRPRGGGESTYTIGKLVRLTWQIVFNYSLMPLRAIIAAGLFFSLLFGLVGLFYLIRGAVVDSAVPGWTTLMVFMALSNSILLALLSVLGEYVGSIKQTLSLPRRGFVYQVLRGDRD